MGYVNEFVKADGTHYDIISKPTPLDGGDKWSAETTYYVGDYAIYNDLLYKCKQQNINTVPTNSSYWEETSIVNELIGDCFKKPGQTSSSILSYINDSGMTFGSMGFAGGSDLPASAEFEVIWFGSDSRITVIANRFTTKTTYIRAIFNGAWQNSWTQIF